MNRLRKLSTIEANMAYNHALYGGSSQVCTLLSLEIRVTPEHVQQAMATLFRRHPLLRTCIREEEDSLWFYDHDDYARIDLACESLEHNVDLDSVLRAELNQPLDATIALWRMRVFHDAARALLHVIFTRHHAISDAHSSNRLLAEFTGLLAGESDVPQDDCIAAGADLLWSAQPAEGPLPTASTLAPAVLAHYGHAAPGYVTTGIHSTRLGQEQSESIRQYCRRHSLSVNALFSALLAQNFCRVTDSAGIGYFTATSLRQRLVPGKFIDHLGCFIAVEACYLHCQGRTSQEIARHYQAALGDAMGRYQPSATRHQDLKARLSALGGSHHFMGIGITNMGVLDGVINHAAVRPLRFLTVVNRNAGNAALVLHLATFQQEFLLTFTYPEILMDPAVVADTCKATAAATAALTRDDATASKILELSHGNM